MNDDNAMMFTGKSPVDGTKYLKGMPLRVWAETLAESVGIAEEPGNWQPKVPRADRVLMIMNNMKNTLKEVIADGAMCEEFDREFVDTFLAALPDAPPGEDTLMHLFAALARMGEREERNG